MQPNTQYPRTPIFFIQQNVWTIDKCEGYLPLTTKSKRRQTKARKNRVKETEILELKFQTRMLKAMAQQRRRFEDPKPTTKKTSENHFFSQNGKSVEISQQSVKKIEV